MKIETANKELIQLKRTCGRTIKTLNQMKKKLAHLVSEATFFAEEMKEREALLKKAESDLAKVSEDKEHSRKECARLRASEGVGGRAPVGGTAGGFIFHRSLVSATDVTRILALPEGVR